MLLCFFLRAEESKNMARLCLAKKGVWGISPSRVKPCWMQLLRRVIITLIPLEPLQ